MPSVAWGTQSLAKHALVAELHSAAWGTQPLAKHALA